MIRRALALGAALFLGPLVTPGCHEELGRPDSDAGADASLDAPADGPAESGPATVVLPTGQIDRAGRPLISLLIVPASGRDDYNGLDSFDEPLSDQLAVDFQAGLVRADLLDGKNDWGNTDVWFDGGDLPDVYTPPPSGFLTHPLGKLLASDYLLVDPAKPFSPSSFWDIEQEILPGGTPHSTCGGRSPYEDTVDKMLSIVIAKNSSGVSDGVGAPSVAPASDFPYLASPH